jgi:hypothetical protein
MARRAIEDLGDDDPSDEPAMSILSEMEAGETLVWSGRPRSPRRLVMRTVPRALSGLAFLAFTLFWMAMVVRGGHNKWDKGRAVRPFEPENVVIATLVGLWMIPPGLYMLTWPLRTRSRLKGTHYALTDRRAVIGEPGFLGRARVRSYRADSLRLMRSEDHDDGTGDLIFESPSTWVGMTQTVGFLAIEGAREVEALVRRTLSSPELLRSESPARVAHLDPAISGRKTYRLSPGIRFFQFVSLAAGLLAAFCIIGDLVVLLGLLIFRPRLLFAFIADMKPPGAVGAVVPVIVGMGSILVAVLVGWSFLYFALVIPFEITIDEDGAVGFRSRLRTVTIPAGDITSITTGAWFDPNTFQAVVRHKGGKLALINQFAGFRDFLTTLRGLNPSVEIKGF